MPQFFIPSKEQMSPVTRDFSETARYLGYQKVSVPDEQTEELIRTAAAELLEVIKPQAVYEQFDLNVEYDEEAGFADAGIEAGTAWADVPEDFECPLCGASKDQFSEDE